MKVWRLTDMAFRQTAMDGIGGLYAAGRWHSKGRRVIYTAQSLSLALLEVVVQSRLLVTPMFAIIADVPDDLVLTPELSSLPDGWDSARPHARLYGDSWLQGQQSAGLQIPSVIVPVESNIILNPEHPDFKSITYEEYGPVELDARLLAMATGT